MFMLLAILFCTSAYYYWQWRSSRKHFHALAEKIPSTTVIPELPVIGHLLHFSSMYPEKIMSLLFKIAYESMEPKKVWMGPLLWVLVQSPEDVEAVFNSNHANTRHGVYRKFTKKLIGNGILTSQGPVWKKHRKIILPALSQKVLESFVPTFVEQVAIMAKIFEKKEGEWMDITKAISDCTLDMICESAMGIKINAQGGSEISHAVHRVLELIGLRMFNVIHYTDLVYKLSEKYREEKQLLDSINELTSKVIRDKRMERANKDYTTEKGEKKQFLTMMMEPNKEEHRFTDKELQDEVNTFIIAGTETSATVACFTLICLAIYPDIQDKVYEEVLSIMGNDGDIQSDDMVKFQYLDRVIKEAMRIFPIAPVVPREVEGDIKLKNYTIPKGSGVLVLTIGTQLSPEYFPDPLKFDPDRFLPEEVAKRHPFAYYPFTAGIRKCIGPNFGVTAVKTIVATMIQKFVMETTYTSIEDIRLKLALTLKPVRGFPLRVRRRNNN